MVVPNNCNNTHDCSMQTGDNWLSRQVRAIVSRPAYMRGRIGILITWDEGAGGRDRVNCLRSRGDASCHVPLFVISPYTRVGARTSVKLSHYSILKTVERGFGLRRLGHAGSRSTHNVRWCVSC
jgi:phospholipase C